MVKLVSYQHIFFRTDTLTIYDGDSITSPILGNPFCGDSLPPNQTSSSNHLFIRFFSDASENEAGFKFEYYEASKNTYTSCQNVWSGSKSVVTFGLIKILTHPC